MTVQPEPAQGQMVWVYYVALPVAWIVVYAAGTNIWDDSASVHGFEKGLFGFGFRIVVHASPFLVGSLAFVVVHASTARIAAHSATRYNILAALCGVASLCCQDLVVVRLIELTPVESEVLVLVYLAETLACAAILAVTIRAVAQWTGVIDTV